MMALALVPLTRDQAMAYVQTVHRHHGRPQGYRFAVGVADDGRLCGVAMAGRPVSRVLAERGYLEVTRVATDGTANACSALYGACWRAARALGYQRAVTYTQVGESGASLRASGWVNTAALPARRGWTTPSRRRSGNGNDDVGRLRWEIWTPTAGAPKEQVEEEVTPALFPLALEACDA